MDLKNKMLIDERCEELKLNIDYQIEPTIENINLMINFLYGGSFDKLFDEIVIKEVRKR